MGHAPERIPACEFQLFAELPPEIRTMIWREVLPLDLEDSPAVFRYKSGCWKPRHLLPSDPEYLHNWGPDHNIDFSFHGYLLDPVQVYIPLYHVNREARQVARAWMRLHCTEIWPYMGQILFSRWFDKDLDILYVPEDAVNEFLAEPDERPFEPDLIEKTLSVGCDSLTRIALPATGVFDDPRIIADMFPNYGANILYLVVGRLPDNWLLIDGKVSRRFELREDTFGPSVVWDASSATLKLEAGEPDVGVPSDYIGEMEQLLRFHGDDLQNQLSRDHVRDFKIRPMCFKH